MTEHKGTRKWPIGAIAVAAVTIVAVVLPFVTDSGCGSSGPDLSVSEPMELRGRWLGLRLAPADSPSAAELGVPPTVLGVVVVEVAEGASSRARQAGVTPGDVIIGVEGDATNEIGQRVVGIMNDAGAAAGGQPGQAGERGIAIRKEVGIEAFGVGIALDLGTGCLERVEADRAHGMREVERLAPARERDPGRTVDHAAGVVDEEEPLSFAGGGDSFLNPVVESIDGLRPVEGEARKIRLHDLQVVVEGDAGVECGVRHDESSVSQHLENGAGLWIPVPHVNPAQMRTWIDNLSDDVNFWQKERPFLAYYILDPGGEKVGAWYSAQNFTTVKFLRENRINVFVPHLNIRAI